jgi:hypothetical protein
MTDFKWRVDELLLPSFFVVTPPTASPSPVYLFKSRNAAHLFAANKNGDHYDRTKYEA